MEKIRRNDPCPCGSGKKHKQCCIRNMDAASQVPQASSAVAELHAAQQHLQAGRLPQAEAIYRQILQRQPNQGEALQMLGMIAAQTGHFSAAIDLLERAVAVNPANSDWHNNLGIALELHGAFDKAIASCQQAIKLKPKKASYHHNLANALLANGDLEAAEGEYNTAISLQTGYAEAHYGLGNTLGKMYRFEEAISHYQKSIALKPGYIHAYNNMGLVLSAQGKADQAIACFTKVLKLEPGNVAAYNNLGNVMQAQTRLEEALANYQHAIAIDPEFADAHNNIGRIREEQTDFEAAIASYKKAITYAPHSSAAYTNLANTLLSQGKISESLQGYRDALDVERDAQTYSNYLLACHYSDTTSQAEVLAEHQAFAQHFEASLVNSWRVHIRPQDDSRPINVGLVSGDLYQHPVGYFLENVLANLDRNKISITLYSCNRYEDALTARIKSLGFSTHSLVSLSDELAAQKISDDKIDILVDLSGHTAHNRLPVFARKPAPVQVSWLGYWATTGLQAMDYILVDKLSIPADEAGFFVETPYYLPSTRLCFTPPEESPAVEILPALQNNYITFGSFNNLAKMNEVVVGLWANILRGVPNSRLFLKTGQLNSLAVQQRTIERFAHYGIAQDRLILEGKSSREDYLRSYHRVDIALDSFPFTGATTSVEALWMGVPVLTRKGNSMLSRQGEGLLSTIGLSDWVAANDDEYLRCAVAKASDLAQLAELRQRLRAQLLASPVCDAAQFARDLESAFGDMWQQYCMR